MSRLMATRYKGRTRRRVAERTALCNRGVLVPGPVRRCTYSIFTVRTGLGVRRPPLMVPVALDGQKVEMELDTGATLSVCSDAGFRQLWPCGGPKLEPCSVKLKTYSGEQLPVMGQAAVNVQYGGQAQRLPLIVVEGGGPWLFGRNWLGHIRLDWPSIC